MVNLGMFLFHLMKLLNEKLYNFNGILHLILLFSNGKYFFVARFRPRISDHAAGLLDILDLQRVRHPAHVHLLDEHQLVVGQRSSLCLQPHPVRRFSQEKVLISLQF